MSKPCDSCQCNDCLKNTGILKCPGCANCIPLETDCKIRLTMEDFLNEKDVYIKQIYKHFSKNHGPDAQWWKLLEEAGELIVEFSKHKMDWKADDVISEAADYVIVARQLLKSEYEYDPRDKTVSEHLLYDTLAAPSMIYFRKNGFDLFDAQQCIIHILNCIYTSIEEAGVTEKFNITLFEKIMRTLNRIETKYYEED